MGNCSSKGYIPASCLDCQRRFQMHLRRRPAQPAQRAHNEKRAGHGLSARGHHLNCWHSGTASHAMNDITSPHPSACKNTTLRRQHASTVKGMPCKQANEIVPDRRQALRHGERTEESCVTCRIMLRFRIGRLAVHRALREDWGPECRTIGTNASFHTAVLSRQLRRYKKVMHKHICMLHRCACAPNEAMCFPTTRACHQYTQTRAGILPTIYMVCITISTTHVCGCV